MKTLIKKKTSSVTIPQSVLTDKHQYRVSPSFVEHNGVYTTILELYNRPGSNRSMTYADILGLLPTDPLEDITLCVVVNDALIKGDAKKKLIRKNAQGGKATITDTALHGAKEDKYSMSSAVANQSDVDDYNDYELILDKADPVVVYTVKLVVTGKTRSAIDEQITILNVLLDQKHEGARWDSLAGDQTEKYVGLFAPTPKTRFTHTSTSANYAGLNFSVNSGLNDPDGWPIGKDVLALADSTVMFDMDASLHRQAVISVPRDIQMARYSIEDAPSQPPVGSLMAQYAANQAAIMGGCRVHHMVFNDFDYRDDERYYRPTDMGGVCEWFDAAELTINPLQGFGELTDVEAVYNRVILKIVNIFNVLTNLTLDEQSRGIILDALDQFYQSQQLWFPDGALYPRRTRIVNIPDPDTYPTLGLFINEFTTLVNKAMRENRERRADQVEALQATLRQALAANRSILGRPTSITASTARQVYYNFGGIPAAQTLQLQALNILDYVTWTARAGDIIVFHGTDQLWSPLIGMLKDTIVAAQNRGVRFIFSFDAIALPAGSGMKQLDMFDLRHVLFDDMDQGVDWSVIGRCQPTEVAAVEDLMSVRFSDITRSQLMFKTQCQALIHRAAGAVDTFAQLNLVV